MERIDIADLLRAYLERERCRVTQDRMERSYSDTYDELAQKTGIDLDRNTFKPWEPGATLRPLFELAVQCYGLTTNPFDTFHEGSTEIVEIWKTHGRRVAAAEEERRKALFDLMRGLVIRMYGPPPGPATAEKFPAVEPEPPRPEDFF